MAPNRCWRRECRRLNEDHVIEVEHVSKRFARSLKRAMVYGMTDIARMALLPGRRDHGLSTTGLPSSLPPLRPSEFWALNDVNLTIRRGECVGILGHNGAGKSTLFSILSGIYGPSRGQVRVRGRLQALIALGAGFHPALTGRENIYINAAILGLTKRQIDERFDQIVAFSELEQFLDAPIKNYSSGMMVRLGFSVAAHLDPDILLIDEVLAVGDISFQRKCLSFLQSLQQKGASIVLVSHNTASIESVCSRVIWMDHGRVVQDGPAQRIIAEYVNSQLRKSIAGSNAGPSPQRAREVVEIRELGIRRIDGTPVDELKSGEPFRIRIGYVAHERVEHPYFHLVLRIGITRLANLSMLVDGQTPPFIEGEGCMDCIVEDPRLDPNAFTLGATIRTHDASVDTLSEGRTCTFIIASDPARTPPSGASCPVSMTGQYGGILHMNYRWDHDRS